MTDREKAVRFLARVHAEANAHADHVDPRRRRQYARDPLLRALDGIVAASGRALAAIDPTGAVAKEVIHQIAEERRCT